MQLLEPGGVLRDVVCTGVLSDDDFERVVRDAASSAPRVQVLRRGGAGPDHPWLRPCRRAGISSTSSRACSEKLNHRRPGRCVYE